MGPFIKDVHTEGGGGRVGRVTRGQFSEFADKVKGPNSQTF